MQGNNPALFYLKECPTDTPQNFGLLLEGRP